MAPDVRRAVAARDAASRRVRRLTAAVGVAGVGSTVVFASLAAGSSQLRHAVHRHRPVARALPRAPERVVAPAPPLVAVQGAANAPTPAPAPAPAPAAVPQPPVVVSGGS